MNSEDNHDRDLSAKEARWHEIADGEIDAPADLDPEALEEIQAIESLSAQFKAEMTPEVEPAYPDFFNSQIRRFIERDEEEASSVRSEAVSGATAVSPSGFWKWFPWVAAGAACCAALWMGMRSSVPGSASGSGNIAAIASPYAPSSTVEANSWYSAEADADIIELVGLEDFPADREILGQRVASYPIDGSSQVAHRLRDGEGKVLTTLVAGPGETPHFFRN